MIAIAVISPLCSAEVVVNAPIAVTKRVQIQPIRTRTASAVANTFGTAASETYIKQQINRVWAQAGIRIDWLPMVDYTNDFAYSGAPANYTVTARPTTHLATIVNGATTPPKSASAIVINLFFVQIVPAFAQTSANTANGFAFVDSNGVTQYNGANLFGFTGGLDVIAKVMAHEIGHNLGLDHNDIDPQNLMATSGGEARLTTAQRNIVLTDKTGIDGFDFLQNISNYSQWAATNNVTGGPGDDDDFDGIDNAIEFMFQKNPKAFDRLPQPVIAANGQTWTLPKYAPAVADGLVYRVTTSSNLTAWLPAGADSGRSTVLQNDTSALVVRLLSGGDRRFMRLDIDLPTTLASALAPPTGSGVADRDAVPAEQKISDPVDILTVYPQ